MIRIRSFHNRLLYKQLSVRNRVFFSGYSLTISITKVIYVALVLYLLSLLFSCGGGDNAPARSDDPILVGDSPSGGETETEVPNPKTEPKPETEPVPVPVLEDPIEDPLVTTPPVELQFDSLNTQPLPELVGNWNTIFSSSEQRLSFNADASCEFYSIAYGLGEAKINCRWGIIDHGNEFSLIIEGNNNTWVSYDINMPNNKTYRISGGDIALESQLYSKMTANTLTEKTPGRWIVGTWELIPFLYDKHLWTFAYDGSLVIWTYLIVNNAYNEVIRGTWQLSATHLSYQIDDSIKNSELPASGSWKLTDVDMNTFVLDGAYNSKEYFRRQSMISFKAQAFVGQYVGPETSLTISQNSNQSYRVKILRIDQLSESVGHAVNGKLQVELPVQFQETGNPYMVLSDTFNGLNMDSAPISVTSGWPVFYRQLTDTEIIPPTQIVGTEWIGGLKFSKKGKYQFLTDGQYIYSSGAVREEGYYQINGNQFTLDPMCSAPMTYNFSFVENHLVFEYNKVGGGTFPYTYQFQPNSHRVARANTQHFNIAREKVNVEWRAKVALANIDPTFVPLRTIVTNRGPVTVGPDLTPGNVIAGAKVFQDVENFHWITPFPICQPPRFELCDTAYFVFHANGRALYYSESKFAVDVVTGQPVGSSSYYWLPYSVENDQIKVGDSLVIDIIGGRRRLRINEWCFDNNKWITAP